MIESLESKHKFLSLFFSSLIAYKKTASGKKKSSKSSLDINTSCPSSKHYTHLDEIRVRLSLLEFILANSPIVLSTPQVDIIWDNLISNALSSEERKVAFSWLERSNTAFSDQVIHHLFEEKMQKMECSDLTPEGFRVFNHYFLFTNEKASKVKKEELEEGVNYIACSPSLIGIETYWKVVFDARDIAVANQAIQSLNSLHENVEEKNSKSKGLKIREGTGHFTPFFLNLQLEYIKSAISYMNEAVEKDNSQTISRSLRLLKDYVVAFNAPKKSVKKEEKKDDKKDEGKQLGKPLRTTKLGHSLKIQLRNGRGKEKDSTKTIVVNTNTKGRKFRKQLRLDLTLLSPKFKFLRTRRGNNLGINRMIISN